MIRDNSNNKLSLFTDGSVHAQSKIGFGAYLLVTDVELSVESFKGMVKVKYFENTSSTKLEIQTLLWALKEVQELERNFRVYTDSQNILGLRGRRERFEKNEYRSKNNLLLKNHELYKEFFRLSNRMGFEIVKVQGHKVANKKDNIDRLFTLVDRASRNALRKYQGKLKPSV